MLKIMLMYSTVRRSTCRLCNSTKFYYGNVFGQVEKCNEILLKKSYCMGPKNPLDKLCTEVTKQQSIEQNNSSLSRITITLPKIKEIFNDMFSQPTITIERFFNQLAMHFEYEQLLAKPFLTKLDNKHGVIYWCCKYQIKWPELMEFYSVGSTKKKASENSAQEVLNYLQRKNVISLLGTPLICSGKSLIQPAGIYNYSTITNGQTNNNNEDTAMIQLNKGEYSEISSLFPTPKNTLDNFYAVIMNEKGSKNLAVTYKQNGKQWLCTYAIEWPEKLSFSVKAHNKRRSSTECAWKVLHYLLKNNRITKKGAPIMYNKEQMKVIARESIPILMFQEEHMKKCKEIVDMHVNSIFPIISEMSQNIEDVNAEEELSIHKPIHYQDYFGMHKYKCKEELVLPVSDYKEEIINMSKDHRVVVVKGEPGCGKSTRIPQYILEGWAREADEAKPCRIVVTEPRRIAAISLAERVASERHETVGSIIGYQVRFKSNFQKRTGRILYCTNGILLQHLKSDPNFNLFTHVIVDEAHERDLNTDRLLNILKNALEKNPSLKIIIMSATLDANLFQNYFPGSPLLHIPGFTYPVKSHFLEHCKLNMDKTLAMCSQSKPSVIHEDVARVLMHLHRKKPEGAILCFLPGWEDIRKVGDLIPPSSDLTVLYLHSRLKNSEQWRIFSKLPPGNRKIILSTNIAETSVTIDDVVYVVDTGIHKETMLDIEKGVMCIDNHWISKSNVQQRKGRAGRVREGECFHLYPKSKMESFPQFSLPEILRVSLTKVVLDSKTFERDVNALEFFNRLPSPPNQKNIELALNELKDLELIDNDEKLTPLGRVAVNFQLEPKLSKTLVNSVIFKCVTPIVDIITLFSSSNELFKSSLENKERMRSSKTFHSKTSDHLSLMRIFEIWNDLEENGNSFKAEKYCENMWIQPTQMKLMKRLRDIHFDYIQDGLKCNVLPISDDLSDDDEMVKAILLSGVGTYLSHKNWDITNGKLRKSNTFLTRLNHKATITTESVNYRNTLSNFLLYINETRSNLRRTSLIRETSVISPLILLLFSNKKLLLVNIDRDQYSSKLKSEDQVILKLSETNSSFYMDRKQALIIMQCKLAISSCYDYYIYQLTKGGGRDEKVNDLWHDLLLILRDLLNDFKSD